MNLFRVARLIAAVGVTLSAISGLAGRARADDLKPQIDEIIRPFFEQKKAVGMVVGVVRGDQRRVFGYGRISPDSNQAPDGDTVFEIGSITKTFTSLLLARMVEEGMVKLDDPVRLCLPADVRVPARNGKEITLAHLATHTSGLPRTDDGWRSIWDTLVTANPYKGYRARNLYVFLAHHELTRDPGAEWEYSNLGMGFLGHALACKANASYEDLVVRHICTPLGMKSTRITLSGELRSRLAPGHIAASHPTANWDFDALAGCGALRSSANDMLRYLAANLGLHKTPLQSAIDLCHEARHKTDIPNEEQGLGWIIGSPPDVRLKVIWHNGGTFGYLAYAAFVKEARAGVVVLSNCFAADPDAAGLAILKRIATPRK